MMREEMKGVREKIGGNKGRFFCWELGNFPN